MAASIAEMLRRERYAVRLAADAESGLVLVRELPADLVVLDVSLPGIDGFEACRRLRSFSEAYVIMLSGRGSEIDRLAGLSAGADDYLTKPFYPRELIARIEAMRRRPRPTSGEALLRFGELEIDTEAQRISLAGQQVELTQNEYRLLSTLAAHPSRSFSRTDLLRKVQGEEWVGDEHLIDVHVSNLRRKLGDDPDRRRFVLTIRGVGYRMGRG